MTPDYKISPCGEGARRTGVYTELEITGDDRPLTVNALAPLHRMTWAGKTKRTRKAWCELAEACGVTGLGSVIITATPLHKDMRSPQDVAACAPEVKGAIDGLVDAGMLADDAPEYFRACLFLPPIRNYGANGLRLLIEQVSP